MVDYFSFEDVLKELELDEQELKRMVSEGEIRAFRDENKMKFRKEDVTNLKVGKITEPTIILPSTGATPPPGQIPAAPKGKTPDVHLPPEEEIINIEQDVTTGSVPTETLEFENLDVLETEPEPEVEFTQKSTFLEAEETGITEPLILSEEGDTSTVTVDAFETVTEDVTVAVPTKVRKAKAAAAIPYAVEEAIEKSRPHWIWTIFLFLTFLVVLYSTFFFYDHMRMNLSRVAYGVTDQPMELTKSFADWFLEKFWTDPEWVKMHERDLIPDKETREKNSHPDNFKGFVQATVKDKEGKEQKIQAPLYVKPDAAEPKDGAAPPPVSE